MKAVRTTEEKTYEVIFKPYSDDILGYSAILEGCGHFFVINSIHKDKSDKICSELKELSISNFQKFILLQKNGNVYKTDNLNFIEKSDVA